MLERIGTSFHQLWCICALRRSIPTLTAIRLVNNFVVSKIDNCNSLLADHSAFQLEKIQSILNYAAHLIYGRRKYNYVMPLLCENQHWLHVLQRVHCKCCLLVYKAVNGLAPPYITSYCCNVSDVQHHSTLHSAATNNLSYQDRRPSSVTDLLRYLASHLRTSCRIP